jgi:hypothetical protein
MPKTYRIRRRSGRQVKELTVELPKPPREYETGEVLTIEIEGRPVVVHVEIHCLNNSSEFLYVA